MRSCASDLCAVAIQAWIGYGAADDVSIYVRAQQFLRDRVFITKTMSNLIMVCPAPGGVNGKSGVETSVLAREHYPSAAIYESILI